MAIVSIILARINCQWDQKLKQFADVVYALLLSNNERSNSYFTPLICDLLTRSVHGSGNSQDMGFPWEWKMSWIERGNVNGNQARWECE